MNQEILAIIPARSGSKGLIDKNILPLNSHPLLTYSVGAALGSELITRVIVSTDSSKYADIAINYGAEVPFLRPDNLADDKATDLQVFEHCLKQLEVNEGYSPDFVVQLRPTSPIRPSGLIDECIKKLVDSDFDSLRVVTESPLSPYKVWRIGKDEQLTQLLDSEEFFEPYNMPRQKLPKVFWQVGTLDIIRSEIIKNMHSMSGERIMSYIISPEIAVDIDDLRSFKLAEEIIKTKNIKIFEDK